MLADRVILIEEGKVVMNKEINLPRPRKKDSIQYSSLAAQILDRVMQVEGEMEKKRFTLELEKKNEKRFCRKFLSLPYVYRLLAQPSDFTFHV